MMKNLFKLGALALVLVLVTGCGGSKGKTLTCTKSEDETGMKSTQTMKVSFSDDKASKINMTMKMDIDEEYSSYISAFKSMLDSQFENFKSKSGVKYDSKSDKDSITVDLEVDINKLSEEELGALDLDGSTGTYDEVKKALEKDEYTCK